MFSRTNLTSLLYLLLLFTAVDLKADDFQLLINNSSWQKYEANLKQVTDSNFSKIKKQFEPQTSQTLNIFISTKAELDQKFNLPTWLHSFYHKNKIFIVQNSNKIDFANYQRKLRHELSHFFVDEITEQDPPLWLDEGLAKIFEEGEENSVKKSNSLNKSNTVTRPNSTTKLKIKSLKAINQNLKSEDNSIRKQSYAQAKAITLFLIRKTTWTQLRLALTKAPEDPLTDLNISENILLKEYNSSI